MAMLHLMLLCAWAGVVATEVVLEIGGVRGASWATAVPDLHYFMDLIVELPILVGVVVTGAILARGATWDATLVAKVGCGLGAVATNVACVALVVARRRGRDTTRAIFACAIAGLPLAVAAAVLGFWRSV